MRNEPAHVYYRACVGSWGCPLNVEITDPVTAHQQLGILATWSLRVLRRWPRWLGTWRLQTTVAYDPTGVVQHTTCVVWGAVRIVTSLETLTITGPTTFELKGSACANIFPWFRVPVDGAGHVEPCATRANYTVTANGAQLQQRAHRDGEQVTLSQQGPGFKGLHPLARRAQHS